MNSRGGWYTADVNSMDGGYTALMWTSYYGNDKIVNSLTKAGGDVNITHYDGDTALYYTVLGNHSTCVDSLIKAGADVNATVHTDHLYVNETD